jgi:hypothetical protein
MATSTRKTTVKKKAVRKNTNEVMNNRVTFTYKQVETLAAYYTKNGNKVPAFLAKKLM